MLGVAVCPLPQAIYIFHIRTLQALKKGIYEKIIKIIFLSYMVLDMENGMMQL